MPAIKERGKSKSENNTILGPRTDIINDYVFSRGRQVGEIVANEASVPTTTLPDIITQSSEPSRYNIEQTDSMENFKLSRGARRKNLLQVDSLVDGNVKTAVGIRRVEEILQRCYYLASKKGQDLHTLRKSLKDDEEKDASEKIARRLAAYFDSLNGSSDTCQHCSGGHDCCSHVHQSTCSCFRIADWPALDPEMYSSIDRDSDSDDLTSELYSTVYLGGTSDWANKFDSTSSSHSYPGPGYNFHESNTRLHPSYHLP